MEPSTPPRSSRSRDFPATPATPRFGSFGDLPDQPGKHLAVPVTHGNDGQSSNNHSSSMINTPTRRKRTVNALATPRQTPRKRRDRDILHNHQTDAKLDNDLLHKLRAPEPVPLAQQKSTQPHPHQDAPPPNVPGMWYVFRGKKVFRPLPPGEKPVEPVTLFKDILDEREPRNGLGAGADLFDVSEEEDENGSEADTDVEWDSI